jgi:hypothetical protein
MKLKYNVSIFSKTVHHAKKSDSHRDEDYTASKFYFIWNIIYRKMWKHFFWLNVVYM